MPGPNDAVLSGRLLFDMDGKTGAVEEIRKNPQGGPTEIGVRNGRLNVGLMLALKDCRVVIEKGGELFLAHDCYWRGGNGSPLGAGDEVTVRDGGRLTCECDFSPAQLSLTVEKGGTMTLSPRYDSFLNADTPSAITNCGTFALPNGFVWQASGKLGASLDIVQSDGVLDLGGELQVLSNRTGKAVGELRMTWLGGTVKARGHVACTGFSRCVIAPNARVVLDVAEGGSFDLSPFVFSSGAKIVKRGTGTVVVGGGAPPAGLVVEEGALSYVPFIVHDPAVKPVFTQPSPTRCPYEPITPVLDEKVARTVSGVLHGRACGLIRLTGENAVGDESAKEWKAIAWRNESVHGQFVAWTRTGARRLRATVSPLVSATGATIPASAVSTRFVRYVLGHAVHKGEVTEPEQLFGDCLDDREQIDLPTAGFRPVWLTVRVPSETAPGVYRGDLTLRANADEKVEFPLELTVRSRTLPSSDKWTTFLDVWQQPWAISRYHGVKPFSPLHWQLMEPYLRELASAGQKVITTTVVDRPWGQGNNYEGFGSMVEVTKRTDGSWAYDYSLFDAYVAFAKKCGLGPQIHAYTLAGFKTSYTDERTGERLLSVPAAEREAYWTAFLKDFENHVRAKGWIGDVYVALDESSPAVLKASADLLRRVAPGLKLAMAGERKPSEYCGVDIDNFSVILMHVTPDFLVEARARRAKGQTTSYYICCGPSRPNTFLKSPLCESAWQGVYIAATGIDGLLRWAAYTWPLDPLFDGSFVHWAPGDTYLLYPGPRASTRWEMLKDGLELAEKIRLLRAEGRTTPEMERLLDPSTFGRTSAFYAERTAAVFAAVDAIE